MTALGSYYASSKITEKSWISTLTGFAAGIMNYTIYAYLTRSSSTLIPSPLFTHTRVVNSHTCHAQDWDKYLNIDPTSKNALLDEPYPEFLKKLYINANFYDHPIRESNKLGYLNHHLAYVTKMSILEQKWHMLKLKKQPTR